MYYCGRPIYTIPEYISRKMKASPNILYNDYGVTFTFSCIFRCLPFSFYCLSQLSPLLGIPLYYVKPSSYPNTSQRRGGASANIYIIEYAEAPTFSCIFIRLPFTILHLSSLSLLFLRICLLQMSYMPEHILVLGQSSANILYNDYAEDYPKCLHTPEYILVIRQPSSLFYIKILKKATPNTHIRIYTSVRVFFFQFLYNNYGEEYPKYLSIKNAFISGSVTILL